MEQFVYNYDDVLVVPTIMPTRDYAAGTNDAPSLVLRKAECINGVGLDSHVKESNVALPRNLVKSMSALVARAKAWLLHIHCAIFDAIDEHENEIVELTEIIESGIELTHISELVEKYE